MHGASDSSLRSKMKNKFVMLERSEASLSVSIYAMNIRYAGCSISFAALHDDKRAKTS